MKFIKELSDEPAFSQKGLTGYKFPLFNEEVEVYFVDVEQGHDKYLISKEITHIYYILDGEGTFDIEGNKQQVEEGDLIEVPPGVEYVYSGEMKLLLIMNPPWFEGNEEFTRDNPAVKD